MIGRHIFRYSFLGNSVWDYVMFLALFIVGIILIRVLKKVIINRLKKWAEVTTTTIDDFIIRIFDKNLVPLLYFGVFYLAVKRLTVAASFNRGIEIIGSTILTIYAVRLLLALINYCLKIFILKTKRDKFREDSLKGMVTVLKVVVWGLGIVFLLDNLGFKVSAIIAGLGVGGIAVALAAQTVLKDLFSYFSIFFDRPFEIGDFIIIGDYLGIIEHIGIKTTRIRSLGGEQIVFSNTDLTNSRVRNYKRMNKRRVVFKLGVVYQTGLKQVKEIPQVIEQIIKNIEETAFDRAHFSSFGDFSLNFETVYYILSSDYNKYMNIQQQINFNLKEEFEKRGIEFAYPTQTLFITK